MKLQFTKIIGLWIFLMGLGLFFLPYGIAISNLDAILFPGITGDEGMIFIIPIFACWIMGIVIAIVGLVCIVLMPFKAKPDR